MKTGMKGLLAVAVSMLLALTGGWDKTLEILLICIGLDYLTGVLLAFKERKLSSEIGAKGLLKKAAIFVVIILAAQLDRVANNQYNLFRTMTAIFYIANEGISILENVGHIGVLIPESIKKYLIQLTDKTKEGEDDGQDNND